MEKEPAIAYSEYGKNPGLKLHHLHHRVSPAVNPGDDWVSLRNRDEQQGNEIEVREEGESEGEMHESVFSVGNPENGTTHVVMKRGFFGSP